MCPRDQFGNTVCRLCAHPDNPGESFCTICNKRFHEHDRNSNPASFITFIIMFLLVTMLYNNKPSDSRTNSDIQQPTKMEVVK